MTWKGRKSSFFLPCHIFFFWRKIINNLFLRHFIIFSLFTHNNVWSKCFDFRWLREQAKVSCIHNFSNRGIFPNRGKRGVVFDIQTKEWPKPSLKSIIKLHKLTLIVISLDYVKIIDPTVHSIIFRGGHICGISLYCTI